MIRIKKKTFWLVVLLALVIACIASGIYASV